MPRIRFYNRRFASRAPMSKHHLWRLPADPPWETRRRSTSRSLSTRGLFGPRAQGARPCAYGSIATPDHLAVIRPPTAARLTARGRLRADWLPLSGLRARWGKSAGALSAGGRSAESHPLTPLVGDQEWPAVSEPRAQSHEPIPIGARQCHRPSRARSAFHRRRPSRTLLRAPVRSAAAR
jgi:hypothetical protein